MMDTSRNYLEQDLNYILEYIPHLWEYFRGQRIFITGGTGFIGCWLLESLIWADLRYSLGFEVVVLTRNPDAFRKKAPHLATYPAISLYPGDVRNFNFPSGKFKYMIHAAAEHTSRLLPEHQLITYDLIVEGTRHTLQFAQQCRTEKFLLISSGAVYGPQPPEIRYISEEYLGAPNLMNPLSAYAEGKRSAETLTALVSRQAGFAAKIARCFTFVGPYLPLDTNFAIGNFIRDGLKGGPIRIKGDGTPNRSYLYAADMAIWLWTIFMFGKSCYPYNVGSEEAISIAQLAKLVADQFEPKPQIIISQPQIPGQQPERYIPSINKAESELGLHPTVKLVDALRKTISYVINTKSTGNV